MHFEDATSAYNSSYNDVHAKFNGNSSWVTPEMSLSEYIHGYAPKKDKNDPVRYTQFMADKLNQALGKNVITANTSLRDIKETLIDAGLDADHVITQSHLAMENPKILKDLNITSTKTPIENKPLPPVVKSNYHPDSKTPVTTNIPTAAQTYIEKNKEVISKAKEQLTPEELTIVTNKTLTPQAKIKALFESPRVTSILKNVNASTSNLFGEDVAGVLTYLEKGGSIADAAFMFKNALAKKNGSEGSDLIGKSNSIIPSMSANVVAQSYGMPEALKPTKETFKKQYAVDNVEISSVPSVEQGNWTSNSFAVNLKSKSLKPFTTLQNVGSDYNGNIGEFYNNFAPVKGNIMFTIQNDIDGARYEPLTTIKEGDHWHTDFHPYVIAWENNAPVVKIASTLKVGDEAFKLKHKIFSMDDFDIKDGKINTVYDSNLNALVPSIKVTDKSTYRESTPLAIGLNDTRKYGGPLPLEEANLYGKSRGGSFLVFSEDLGQQYLTGGSFKNLYDFCQNVQKLHPNKKFKIFASDTGSYSNTIMPKDGTITSDVYRESNSRNSWGKVRHLVLTN